MSITQISKIQVRRGLQENLPQLASAEMGWSLDQRRLFIGNGSLLEGAPSQGNTEILTEYTDILGVIRAYTFSGQESGYVSKTGPSANLPVTRSLQNKIDESVSVKDFGAKGDGATDDTAAIQRTIKEIYPTLNVNSTAVRRVIHFPAGTYLISQPILLPPNITLTGAGKNASVIAQTTVNEVIKFCDSAWQVGTQLGFNGAILPYNIDINELSLVTQAASPIAVIDSTKDLTFSSVEFKGNSTFSAVTITEGVSGSSNIRFNECTFRNAKNGLNILGNVSRIHAYNCDFIDLKVAIVIDEFNSNIPKAIVSTTNYFTNIKENATLVNNGANFTSAYNFYDNVGNDSSNLPAFPVLHFISNNAKSEGDMFTRTDNENVLVTRVLIENYVDTITQPVIVSANGTHKQTTGKTTTLIDNATSSPIPLTIPYGTASGVLEYTIKRGANTRSGALSFSQYQGSTIVFEDNYTETDDIGVQLEVSFPPSTSRLEVRYTSTNTSTPATMKYQLRYFD